MHYKCSIFSPFLCLYSTVSRLDMLYISLLVLLNAVPKFLGRSMFWQVAWQQTPRLRMVMLQIHYACHCWLIYRHWVRNFSSTRYTFIQERWCSKTVDLCGVPEPPVSEVFVPDIQKQNNWTRLKGNRYNSVSQTCLLADPFWLRKITTDPHIVADVDIGCQDDRYPKLEIYISEQISDSHQYLTVAYVTMHCMIWPSSNLLSLASWVQGAYKLDILKVRLWAG